MVVTVGSNITLHIFSPKQQQVIASLFDIAGRLLNRATFGVYKETSEDIPKPAAGIYILQLQGMNELLVQKLKIL